MKALKIGIDLLFVSVILFAQKPELTVPFGHTSIITSLAFSPDGKKILSGAWDGKLILWDVATGKEIRTFGVGSSVSSVSYSPSGKYAVSASWDGNIKLWDIQSGNLQNVLKHGGRGMMMSVTFSPKGKYILSGSQDKVLRLWNLETGNEVRSFIGHTDYVSGVCFSVNGQQALSASWDSTIRLWDINTGRELAIIKDSSRITSVSLLKDGIHVVSGSKNKVVKLWNITTGKLIRLYKGHTKGVKSIDTSPDEKYILTDSYDKTLKLWDLQTGMELYSFELEERPYGNSCLFSPNGKYILSNSVYKAFTLWDTNSKEQIQKFSGNVSGVFSICPIPGEPRFLAGMEEAVKLWDVETGNLKSFHGHTGRVYGIDYSASKGYFITVSWDSTMRLWNLHNEEEIQEITGHQNMNWVKFSPDGRHAVTASFDSTVRIWDINSGQQIRTFKYESELFDVDYSPDGRFIVAAPIVNWDNKIKIWNVENGVEVSSIILDSTMNNRSVIFSPDGKNILAGIGKNLTLWNISNGELIWSVNTAAKLSLNYASNGIHALSTASDGTVHLWNLKNGTEIWSSKLHLTTVNSARYFLDEKFGISGSTDGKIKIWDIDTGNELATMVSLNEADWVVTAPDGLFDASPEAMKLLYYLVGSEIIELNQLKDRYYEPGLLQKLLGYNDEPIRDVTAFDHVNLYPEINLSLDDQNTELNIHLTNRGGGIGKTMIFINGKEVIADARGSNTDPLADSATLTASLENHPYLIPGKKNEITVKAYNAEGYLVSRGVTLECTPPTPIKAANPNLFIVSSGISDYTGTDIDLRFAAKDATDIASALRVGANRLFGTDNTYTYLLTTDEDNQSKPTRENIIKTFEEIAQKAKATDVLVVYLAGHGINWGGQDGDFYYLTQDAYTSSSTAYDDPAIRQSTTLSSNELVELIKKVPALKQVLMIDACFSGKVVENLMAQRDIPSSTLRALDRMKDRTGMHIITGCTADAVSYEASRFSQGLLTYSLIEGIKGAALREDRFVDINGLFQHARERVPDLAEGIGGIQQPVIFSPYGSESFDIGELTLDDKTKIQLATEKPIFVRSSFQDDNEFTDVLELSAKIDDALRDMSGDKLVFVDTRKFPGAYKLVGQYSKEGTRYVLQMKIQATDGDRILIRANNPNELLVKVLDEVEKVTGH